VNIDCRQILGRGPRVNPRTFHVIPLMFEGVWFEEFPVYRS